jgi:hypothetical protein
MNFTDLDQIDRKMETMARNHGALLETEYGRQQ